MTKSDIKTLTVKYIPGKTLTLHFEQPLGTPVTEVDEGTDFYTVGYYKRNTTPIAGETIYVYQVEWDGTTIGSPQSASTDTSGKYQVLWTAPDVDTDTNIYFRAYDSAERPP